MSGVVGEWFAVRCLFASGWPPKEEGTDYEERITLWRAGSLSQAIEMAEVEAREYAAAISDGPDTYLGLAQAYHLADELGSGAEVFSLIRHSDLEPDEYLSTFFDTGTSSSNTSQATRTRGRCYRSRVTLGKGECLPAASGLQQPALSSGP